MKPLIPLQLMTPAGLLLIALSLILKYFFIAPDFLSGFLTGSGIGILGLSLIKTWYNKQSNA